MKARYALLLLIFLGACTSSQPVMTETPTGTAFVAQVTPIDTETIPKAPQPPRPTKHVPTPTVYPASIIRPPTYVRDGTQLPRPAAAISAENASRLVELARWGKGDARAVAYSPDGREVAVATSQGVYFYDAVSYELLHFTVIEIARGPIALSTSLGQVALGTEIGMLVIWDTSSGAFVRKISASEKSINAIAFSPDGKRLYSSDRQNSEVTKVWDVESGVLEGTRKHGAEQFAFSSDGEVMAALDGGRVYVGNAGDDVDLKSFVPHQNPGEGDSDTYTFALSPDGKYVAIGTMYNMRVLIWWIADNTLLHDIRIGKSLTYTSGGLLASPVFRTGPGDNVVTGLAFNPDGKTIAVTTGRGITQQWNVENGLLYNSFVGGGWDDVVYSPDGKTLISWQFTAKFHDAATGELVFALGNHTGGVMDIEYSPDGSSMAIGSRDRKIWLRKVLDGGIIRTFKGHSSTIYDIEFSNRGDFIVSGSHDKSARLWYLDGRPGKILGKVVDWVWHVTISYDDQYVAFTSFDNDIQIARVRDGSSQSHGWGHWGIAYSPTEPLLAISLPYAGNGGINLYTMDDLTHIDREFPESTEIVDTIVFSDDGSLLMATSSYTGFWVWDVGTGENIFGFSGRSLSVNVAGFSPDSGLMAVVYDDQITIWNLLDGTMLYSMPIPFASATSVDFSPDGLYLAVGFMDGTVRIYGVAP